jgi:hypothetical protein
MKPRKWFFGVFEQVGRGSRYRGRAGVVKGGFPCSNKSKVLQADIFNAF